MAGPARVDATVTSVSAVGGQVATITNGFTYTGVLNETDQPAEIAPRQATRISDHVPAARR